MCSSSERNSHRRSPFTLGHHLPTVGAESASVIVSDPSIQIPHVKKKMLPTQWPSREIKGPQNTQNWHHFTRTSSSTHSNYLCLLTSLHLVLLSPFSMWKWCFNHRVLVIKTSFSMWKWCFNHQYADRIFKPRKQAVAYTNFLSIASCRIVNVRYRNDLLVTEIRVAKFGS